jgi:lipoprotein-releasing system ATP-binding protein
MNKILEINNLSKSFKQAGKSLEIIKKANLNIKQGEIIALVGQSGSGKTTLLQTIGLLDRADEGEIFINGTDCSKISEKERTMVRRKEIGFVYQYHHLMPEFTALENAILPLKINGLKNKEAEKIGKNLLNEIGLGERLNHRPAQLSGGEQQRVAIARAIIHKPALLLADEPTGNLDPANADNVFDMFLKTVKKHQLTCLIVTHNQELAKKCDRIVTLKNGVLS